jgi:hypothetical protein
MQANMVAQSGEGGGMRLGDILYFAPGIRFRDVDTKGAGLPDQYRARMIGLYVEPAEACAARGQAFAAGVMLVSCVDALARVRFTDAKVGDRIKRFARTELKSFHSDALAAPFYENFRNGLVHEARIKEGGQFSLEIGSTVEELGGLMLINPARLAAEVRASIEAYVDLLNRDGAVRQALADVLVRDHAKDFANG